MSNTIENETFDSHRPAPPFQRGEFHLQPIAYSLAAESALGCCWFWICYFWMFGLMLLLLPWFGYA